jgi:neurofibromin 1
VRAATQDRNPVPLTQRGARPGSLPGTLLNAVFLNLPSDDRAVRLASWNLLCALRKAYHLEMARQLRPAPGKLHIDQPSWLGLFLPPHSIDLFVGLSQQISLQTPHLSLDVIGAFLEHFQSYNPQQKEYGLLYIQPWIPQIETQLRTGSADFVETTKEIKSVLRAFIRLTYEKPQVCSSCYVLIAISWHGIRISGHRLEKFPSWLGCC